MRSISFLLAFLFAFATTSYAYPSFEYTLSPRQNGNDTSASPDRALKKNCRKIRKLTSLTALASNQTKIDELVAQGRLTADGVTQLQAHAANATTILQTLQSNSTLVAQCDIINAQRKDAKQCNQIQRLTSLAELAGNQTALDEIAARFGMNETRLEEKVTQAATKLQELETNTTLTDFCAQRKAEQGNGNGNDNANSKVKLILKDEMEEDEN